MKKALVFSNYATESGYVPVVRNACASMGIELDVRDLRVNRISETPETLLPEYDILFGKARCALEAMACGAAVILCDYQGLGPIVSSKCLDLLRRQNFGMRTFQDPIILDGIRERIKAYDAADAKLVSDRIRASAGLVAALAVWLEVYEEILAEPWEEGSSVEAWCRPCAEYLQWVNVQLKQAAEVSWRVAICRVMSPALPKSLRFWLKSCLGIR